MDVTNFAVEFTNQVPLYSPADPPMNACNLFRVGCASLLS